MTPTAVTISPLGSTGTVRGPSSRGVQVLTLVVLAIVLAGVALTLAYRREGLRQSTLILGGALLLYSLLTGPFAWLLLLWLLYAGLVAQVFGVAAYLWLVKRLPVKTSSLSILLVPLVGLSSSAILLGERLGWPELLAACLIFGAIGTAFPKERTPVVATAPQAKR